MLVATYSSLLFACLRFKFCNILVSFACKKSLIELSRILKYSNFRFPVVVTLDQSLDDPYSISMVNNLELIELFSVHEIS